MREIQGCGIFSVLLSSSGFSNSRDRFLAQEIRGTRESDVTWLALGERDKRNRS